MAEALKIVATRLVLAGLSKHIFRRHTLKDGYVYAFSTVRVFVVAHEVR